MALALTLGFPDAEYQAAGAVLVSAEEALGADMVLKVRRPSSGEISRLKPGAVVIATMDPYGHNDAIEAMAMAGAATFAMELLPRITRAQSMDVLSSQANLAGYRAVIDAASEYGSGLADDDDSRRHGDCRKAVRHGRRRRRPAGDCDRPGASAQSSRLPTCVRRPRSRWNLLERNSSLSKTRNSNRQKTSGGYAKEMSDAYKAKQADLDCLAYRQTGHRRHHRAHPRPPRRLAWSALTWSKSMRRRIGDRRSCRRAWREIASCRGSGEMTFSDNGVKIVGYSNVTRIPASASALYARNLYAFVETLDR